jgi:hypothetical protein
VCERTGSVVVNNVLTIHLHNRYTDTQRIVGRPSVTVQRPSWAPRQPTTYPVENALDRFHVPSELPAQALAQIHKTGHTTKQKI